LAVTRPGLIEPAADGGFSFAAFNNEFLKRREGFSMLVFDSRDAQADHAEFEGGGLKTYPVFDFQRQARQPDGEEVTVGFSLAFVTDPRMPEAAFFTCQQHAPQYFWKPEYQSHANGARSIEEVIMVAAEPRSLADLFTGLLGMDRVAAHADGLTVLTSRGRIGVVTPQAFEARFPGCAPAQAPGSPHFAGYVIGVETLDGARAILQENGVAFRREGRMLQIAAEDLFGTALGFVELD
jgi:hypothetical protein